MIKPTIGRIVWFYPRGHKAGEQPLAAIVAHVWSDTCVNLAIFDANGQPYTPGTTSVLLVQENSEVPSAGNFCTWMPYQLAAKTEAAEAKAEK
jgi:hypothetical protein